jgi:hypothetical protein
MELGGLNLNPSLPYLAWNWGKIGFFGGFSVVSD